MVTTITTTLRRLSSLKSALLALVLGVTAAASFAGAANAATVTLTTGTLQLTNSYDRVNNPPRTGSWVRLWLDGSSPRSYYNNTSSLLRDDTYTQLLPGTTGLTLGATQAVASPEFDPVTGNANTNAILNPQAFGPITFGVFTTVRPTLQVDTATNRIVGGNLSGWTVSYGNARYPTGTTAPTGTFNLSTGAFEINWEADITNGDFEPYYSGWHLVGRASGF